MTHAMHTNYERCNLVLELDYHTCSNTLKDIHSISSKCDKIGCNIFLHQIHIKLEHPPKCASSYLKWPHQPFVATIVIKEFFANLQPHMHIMKPMTIGHKL